MNQKWINNWEKTRSKGKQRYIVVHTILSMISGVIFSISSYFFGNYNSLIELVKAGIIYLLIFFVFGLICSSVTWKISERIYVRHQ